MGSCAALTGAATRSGGRAEELVLDSASAHASASLAARLRQLQQMSAAREAELEAAERAVEMETGVPAMFARHSSEAASNTGAQLPRFRAASISEGGVAGDDVVASETAKANAKIEADKKKAQAAALQASRTRTAKEKFAECMEKCDEEKAEAETGIKVNFCEKWTDYFCGCWMANGGSCK